MQEVWLARLARAFDVGYDLCIDFVGVGMRIFGALAVAAALSGCASPLDDMLNNRYAEIAPVAPSADIVGTWTGTAGPYLMTIQINADGRGVSCWSFLEKNALGSTKYANGRLHFQDGASYELKRSGDKLLGDSGYTGAKVVVFVPDGNLIEASPYCKNNMS